MSKKKGFTLVELLVTISIMAIISAALFWNGGAFSDRIALSTVAEDVSLAIRDAQSYGSSVRQDTSGTGLFTAGYGIDFDMAHPTYAILFIDKNGNHIYDGDPNCAGTGDECVQKVFLRSGVKIQGLCDTNSVGVQVCTNLQSLQITFVRPSLTATVTTVDTSSLVVSGWASGQVTLVSPESLTKVISVNMLGQISVQ